MSGPLDGIRVLELASIGPGPFAAMLLADLGADVVRIDRPATGVETVPPTVDPMLRGRRSLGLDLKSPTGVEVLLDLVESADALMEGFRPGVCERLGIGPEECLRRNPRLVYGRVTGWGQHGPNAQAPGHDINYIALAGALEPIGRRGEPPVPPLNLVGDFGGGGMLLAVGMLAAMIESSRSGAGQVVDAAMVDGAAVLTSMLYGMRASGTLRRQRGTNFFDTGAHFYNVYETADQHYVSVAAYEPRYYAALRRHLGLDDPCWADQMDEARWPDLTERLAAVFRTRTRTEWCELLEGSDVCFAPVLSVEEAHLHPHNASRGTFADHFGVLQPAPAPRFSRTGLRLGLPPAEPGRDSREVLERWGLDDARVVALIESGVVFETPAA